MLFKLKAPYNPQGDQPQAIRKLVKGLKKNYKFQTLLGVTGSGKTFTMANIIAELNRPTLVIAHNKTLAAQLCNEFREFFPENAVEYFVSYYDYYQPEAYLPRSDTYIEKEAQINEEIDRLRHATTSALLTRRDVVIVASVSCLYGIGSPADYGEGILYFYENQKISREEILKKLIALHFQRTRLVPQRGEFLARGEVIEVSPIEEEIIYRLSLEEGVIKEIIVIDPRKRKIVKKTKELAIFPSRHFLLPEKRKSKALQGIEKELKERLSYFKKKGKLLEAERLERRTKYDLEMIREIGYCNGIENYSRHLSGRQAGEPPDTLLSYFPKDYLLFIDESHVTIPQIRGMYNGDRARKKSLVDYGFRLPSAYDNRPLKFEEFLERVNQCVFVSATPGPFELENSDQVVEQIIRPTGLVDPEVIVRPVVGQERQKGQVEDLLGEIRKRVRRKERVLVTTLTKKQAEDLSEYLIEQKISSKYLHSSIDTLERIKILTAFRRGDFDCLVGVNLLREGLDLPEVTLVAILDADKEGFLRSTTSLIQTIGRAARNVSGQVILYADTLTRSLKKAIAETNRRRKKQLAYNKKHGITPQTIKKAIKDIVPQNQKAEKILEIEMVAKDTDIEKIIKEKEEEMKKAAQNLEFELAAILRDQIKTLKKTIK